MFTIEFIEGEGPKVEPATEAGSGEAETPDTIELLFMAGVHEAFRVEETGDEAECPFDPLAEPTTERHWWTRGYSYQMRAFRGVELAAKVKELEAQRELWKKSEQGTLAQMAETNERFEAALSNVRELEAQLVEAEKKKPTIDGYRMRLQECGARNIQLEGQLAEANAKADGWQNRCQEVMAKLDGQSYLFMKLELEEAEAHAARLKAALEQVEWGWVSFGSGTYHEVCAWCRNLKQMGHRSDCERQLALAPESTAPTKEGEKS